MLVSFLDHLYGIWFTPQQTFKALKDKPDLFQASLVVVGLNIIDLGRQSGFVPTSGWAVVGGIWSVLTGVLGWILIAVLLKWLAYCFGRPCNFITLLSLIGFAGIPWIFLAPAQAIGGPLGLLLGLGAMSWFWICEIQAVAVAFDQSWEAMIGLLPLTVLAGFLALGWAFSGIGALISLV